MMAEASRAKLHRLNRFRRSVPHVSASALADILREIDEHGIPETHSRSALKRATDLVANLETPYGTVIQTVDVVMESALLMPFLVVSPLAMLWAVVAEGGCFAGLLMLALEANPNSYECPWRIILYADEDTPGQVLITDNRRKLWAVYWSIYELGMAALSRENAWFCVAAKRSSQVKLIGGGISQIMGVIMKLFFY